MWRRRSCGDQTPSRGSSAIPSMFGIEPRFRMLSRKVSVPFGVAPAMAFSNLALRSPADMVSKGAESSWNDVQLQLQKVASQCYFFSIEEGFRAFGSQAVTTNRHFLYGERR